MFVCLYVFSKRVSRLGSFSSQSAIVLGRLVNARLALCLASDGVLSLPIRVIKMKNYKMLVGAAMYVDLLQPVYLLSLSLQDDKVNMVYITC